MTIIVTIPADNKGNKLFLKDLRVENDKTFIKYRSTYNDIPFMEVELFGDGKGNCIITGDDGTVLWRFSQQFLSKFN